MMTATQIQSTALIFLLAAANLKSQKPQNSLKSGGFEPFSQNGYCIKDGTPLDAACERVIS
ncbi:hypothetical protein Osc1_12820 [Hominimerdicola sp. 21CYCFAH17_S]